MTIKSYKDLIVWQKAVDLSVIIYSVTDNFPKSEIYGITSQIRRAMVAIPSNIAEGQMRGHKAELETQLLISLKIGYLKQVDFAKLDYRLQEILRMLNSLISSLSRT